MGRVEKRMYKRRKSRVRLLRMALVLALLCGVGYIVWKTAPPGFLTELTLNSGSAAVTPDFEKTVTTREVTLAEECWNAIQTGVFSTEEAAVQKSGAYTDRGAPGVVIQDGQKWRVFITCYGAEGEATAVRARLEERQRVDTYLYSWKCPEVRLRLTGMTGQMDAVEAGFTLLTSTAAVLRDTATALDAAQLTTEEVADTLASLARQIELWQDTITSRFGRNIPPLVMGMEELMQGWKADISDLQTISAATELSAALKASAMGMYDGIIRWREALLAE